MKKFFPLRYITTIFFLPFSTLLLVLQTKELFQNPSFRLSFLFAVAVYCILAFTLLKSYLKRENGAIACICGIQSGCFLGADYIAVFLLNHRSDKATLLSLEKINPWVIQIIWLVIVVALILFALPVARRTFSHAQKQKENGTYAHNQKKNTALTIGGAISGTVLFGVTSALPDGVLSFTINGALLIAVLYAMNYLSWLIWLYHSDEKHFENAPEKKISLL